MPATAHILFDLLVVFVAARAGGELFERLRQPAVAGEILTGMFVGPSGLNLVQESQALMTMGLLGIIVLRFVVGLETKPAVLGPSATTASPSFPSPRGSTLGYRASIWRASLAPGFRERPAS